MNNQQFADFVTGELIRIGELIDDKNRDYAGRDVDLSAFANFHEEAETLGLSVEQIWHVWAYKHWTAITTYCKKGAVNSEPIDGRLDDIIGYALLLKGIIKEREENHFENNRTEPTHGHHIHVATGDPPADEILRGQHGVMEQAEGPVDHGARARSVYDDPRPVEDRPQA